MYNLKSFLIKLNEIPKNRLMKLVRYLYVFRKNLEVKPFEKCDNGQKLRQSYRSVYAPTRNSMTSCYEYAMARSQAKWEPRTTIRRGIGYLGIIQFSLVALQQKIRKSHKYLVLNKRRFGGPQMLGVSAIMA